MLLSTYINYLYVYSKRVLERDITSSDSPLEVKGINVIPRQKLCRNCQSKINEKLSDHSIDTFSEDIAVPGDSLTMKTAIDS